MWQFHTSYVRAPVRYKAWEDQSKLSQIGISPELWSEHIFQNPLEVLSTHLTSQYLWMASTAAPVAPINPSTAMKSKPSR